MTIGLICATATAICYAIGSILQSIAAGRTEESEALDPRLLIRMIKQIPYLVGLGFDGLGFLLSIVALSFLPLFLSEAVIASSVAWTAVLAMTFLKVRLSTLELMALPGLVVGLVMLAISALPTDARKIPLEQRWLQLLMIIVLLLLAYAGSKLDRKRSGPMLAVVSGLAYSGMGVAGRSLDGTAIDTGLLADPSSYAVVLYGLLGTLLFAAALQRASVTTVTALVFGIQTVVPAIYGIFYFGDETRLGLMWVAVLGFVLAVGCSLILAGQSEPGAGDSNPGAPAI